MKTVLKAALAVVLIGLLICLAVDSIGHDSKESDVQSNADKGSYTYYFDLPDAAEEEQQNDGIYFYK